ncbi:MAG: glycosyltransferase family 2 protein [Candidatus Dormibacteraceae bacterium]
MPERRKASVIICNYNGLRYLDTCMKALLEQELVGGFEVVVVDNGSHDESVVHLRQHWSEVRIIESGVNLGFAGGNNLGMRESNSEYMVLVNNDTAVRPGWLQALVDCAESNPEIGAVTSKLVFMDRPHVIQNAGSLVLTDGSGGDRGFGEADTGQYDQQEEVFAGCGCGVLYRRAMLDEVGMFDDTFFAYYEDTDLSWRMRLGGWRIVYEPKAVVAHVHTGTSEEWSPFFIFHVDRNRLFMILKNASFGFVFKSFARFGFLSLAYTARAVLRRSGRGAGGGSSSGESRARIQLRVLGSLLRHLPEMLAKRRRIRHSRRLRDAEITRWFYPREQWNARAQG